jgi:hypothetical protein
MEGSQSDKDGNMPALSKKYVKMRANLEVILRRVVDPHRDIDIPALADKIMAMRDVP